MRLLALSGMALLAWNAAAASAQDSDAALQECRAIGDDAARLTCYDKALDAQFGVDQALEAKRAQNRRDRFGLPVDSSGLQLTELEAIVAEVDEDLRTGSTLIVLDNGQVWQLTGGGGLRARMKPGMTVVISESGTGGYRLRVPDKPGFKGITRVS